MSHLLLIDAKYLAHVALYSRRWLALKGRPIGVLYGFWADLLTDIKKFEPTHLAITWDSHHLFRSEIYPEYKQGRQEQDPIKKVESFYSQLDQIQDMLEKSDITQAEVHGLEADDLLALYCRRFKGQITIHSSDQDLWQLLSDDVRLYARKRLTTIGDLACSPDQWLLVKALAGCSGDNVEGIRGIGEKTAIKIIQGAHKKNLLDYSDKIEENLKLVQLPYPLISYRNVKLPTPTPVEDVDWGVAKELFLELEFYSLLDRLPIQ